MHLYLSFQLFQVISETVGRRDNANSLYPGAPQPTQSLKKPPPKKGWRLFGVLHQDLQGTWHALRKADI